MEDSFDSIVGQAKKGKTIDNCDLLIFYKNES